MGLDYTIFHCIYTIPLAVILTIFYGPFFTRQDIYKILILITIAVVATIPWDSYLIRNAIWTYPSNKVLGYTLYSIPVEEVFFFAIQTYITSLIHCVLRKPLVLPVFLRSSLDPRWTRNTGLAFLAAGLATGTACLSFEGKPTYLGLILTWVCPILMLQWSISYAFVAALPWTVTVLPVCLPTLYLWIADANAINAGTWLIENGTKLDYQLWTGLELEEAIFFLATNLMVIGGLVSIDYAFALEEYQILCSEKSSPKAFSLKSALKSVFKQPPNFDTHVLDSLSQAVICLQQKSQSMFLGSALFQGKLRTDLIFLYSFCRAMDDLVDEAGIVQDHDAQDWISWCSKALDATLGRTADETDKHAIITDSRTLSRLNELQSAFDLLPLSRLSAQPLYDLLRGFEMDLNFDAKAGRFPIHTEEDLDLYASRVAGTVAELVLELTYHHYYNNKPIYPADQLDKLTQAGREMGKALQCVNIARDIGRDASIHRVYIPTSWLAEVGLTPSEVIKCPRSARVYMMQQKMLDRANHYYSSSRSAIQQLPSDVQAPIRATVESYMEIGRALRQSKDSIPEGGKLQLPLWRRLAVAWSSM